jgi:signal transduction histidine kinase
MSDAAETARTPGLPDIEAALRMFDETTSALSARIRRLEDVLTAKQQELVTANHSLSEKVRELDALYAYLNLLMGAVASGVLAVSRDGTITTANAAASTALAPISTTLEGCDYHELFPGSPLARVLSGEVAISAYERIVPGRDGERRTLSAKASPLRAQSGDVIGAVEVFEDVTDFRRLQESVERADRLKQLGEMAAGVAHEIRNPLNGIEGFASLLTRDLPAQDPRYRYAQAIVEGVRNLNRTVTGLLEFTKPRRLSYRAVPPGQLAQGCVELVRSEQELRDAREADGLSVALRLDDQWRGEPVLIDGESIRQCLINLLQNACQAIQGANRSAGRVELSIAAQVGLFGQSGIAFLVDDNGPGVPHGERQRIFTPFYTTKDHGTGLGLAVSHTSVSLHGGALTVDDSPLGGARFQVWLPIRPAPSEPAPDVG